MTKTIENFLRYVKIDTQSSEESTTTPSTMKQHDLAGLLVSELEAMGATEITYDKEHCYVYATVPASAGYGVSAQAALIPAAPSPASLENTPRETP